MVPRNDLKSSIYPAARCANALHNRSRQSGHIPGEDHTDRIKVWPLLTGPAPADRMLSSSIWKWHGRFDGCDLIVHGGAFLWLGVDLEPPTFGDVPGLRADGHQNQHFFGTCASICRAGRHSLKNAYISCPFQLV